MLKPFFASLRLCVSLFTIIMHKFDVDTNLEKNNRILKVLQMVAKQLYITLEWWVGVFVAILIIANIPAWFMILTKVETRFKRKDAKVQRNVTLIFASLRLGVSLFTKRIAFVND